MADLSNSLLERGHDLYLVVRPQSPVIEHVRVPAANIKTIPLRNALDVGSAHELAHFVRQHGIEVVHAHLARDYSLAAYAARRNRNTKFIITRHVLFPLSRLHRHTLARATRIIAVSNAVARELKAGKIGGGDIGGLDGRIAVVRNGVDVDRFARKLAGFDRASFRRSKGLPADDLLVGSLGELRPLKRHDDFIRAAAIVAEKFPETHFVLAGVDTSAKGEMRRQLERLVFELNLQSRFHFLGWLNDAAELLTALDVFVSASETESFGLAIAEAMAASAPVVATATEGARELIRDQKTGLLAPIGDFARLAAAIEILLADTKHRTEIAEQAREAVKTQFSLQRMVDEIEQIYLN